MRTRYNVRTGVTKIKSKARQFSNKLTFAVAAGVASIGLAVIPAVSAETTTVTPSNPQGWYIQNTGTNGTVQYVASSGAMGKGALQFTTTNSNDDYTRFRNDSLPMNLSDLTSLSYMTKQVSAPTEAQANADVNLRLYIDNNNDGHYTPGVGEDDVLVYEPYYNNAQQAIQPGVWQTWNISQTSGYWWSNFGFTYGGQTPPQAGGYNTNFHLSDVLAQNPNMKVLSIGLGTGDSNASWVVQADALKVNDTTYNFELDAAPQDQCKDGGWQSMTVNGKHFKNQGDCVSYYATNTKNQPNGH